MSTGWSITKSTSLNSPATTTDCFKSTASTSTPDIPRSTKVTTSDGPSSDASDQKGKTIITTLASLPLPLQPPKPTQLTHHNPVRPQTTEVMQIDCNGPSRLPDLNSTARFKTGSARPTPDLTDQTMRSQLTPQAIKFDLLHNQQSDKFPGLISPIEAQHPP